MYDKKAERDARRFGILDKMQALEDDLVKIKGIVRVEFDIRNWADSIRQVILIPKYFIDPALDVAPYFDARHAQLESISAVCRTHGLHPSGDCIEDMGEHWYIVRSCGSTWP